MLPDEYLALDDNTKAFLIASINLKDELEEAEMKKAERG